MIFVLVTILHLLWKLDLRNSDRFGFITIISIDLPHCRMFPQEKHCVFVLPFLKLGRKIITRMGFTFPVWAISVTNPMTLCQTSCLLGRPSRARGEGKRHNTTSLGVTIVYPVLCSMMVHGKAMLRRRSIPKKTDISGLTWINREDRGWEEE